MEKPHYHDTVNELNRIDEFEDKAKSQEDKIYSYMKSCSVGQMFSPDDIHDALFKNTPITSVRRAMSNLTRDNLIVKTNHKTEGRYGRSVYMWMIPVLPVQGKLWNDSLVEDEFNN